MAAVENPLRRYVQRLAATPLGIFQTTMPMPMTTPTMTEMNVADQDESLQSLARQLQAFLPGPAHTDNLTRHTDNPTRETASTRQTESLSTSNALNALNASNFGVQKPSLTASLLSTQIWHGIARIDKLLEDIEANRDGRDDARTSQTSQTSASFDTSLSVHVEAQRNSKRNVNADSNRLADVGELLRRTLDASVDVVDDADLVDAYARSRQLGALVRRYKNLDST